MIIIRDEQIFASVIVLTKWSKVLPSFMDAFYKAYAGVLSANGIAWYRNDFQGLRVLEKTYSKYFAWRKTYLEYIQKNPDLAFNAFLATLPEQAQNILGEVTKRATGVLK